jgi:hypothetical protein
MRRRRSPVLVIGAIVAAGALPTSCAARSDRSFNPCDASSPRTPRIVVVFKETSNIFGVPTGCKPEVHPEKKTVCQGDTVSWTVVNTCDTEAFANLLIPDLNEVTATACSGQAIASLPAGKAEQIQCALKANIAQKVKYSISSGNTVLVDPELDIRR